MNNIFFNELNKIIDISLTQPYDVPQNLISEPYPIYSETPQRFKAMSLVWNSKRRNGKK